MRGGAAALLLYALLGVATPAPAAPTVAENYDSFFLWAGVKPQPVLQAARSIYLLESEVVASTPVRLVAQRPAIPQVRDAEVWMVVRVQTLAWTPAIYDRVLASLARWRNAGNSVVGVQIDFDAGTRHLENYAAFLADLRQRLPADCRLGITGLLDWSSHGDPAGLKALAGVVDEVVLQIYQGRHVIPGYEAYLASLDRVGLPFRIGLIQGGDWERPETLAANPWFQGYVVFLVNAGG
ncbi:MAG TPA: DUF3142 domain-containing protein [Candidatus Cybelea sp.]|nr:DUF3142 domain-containing protein [Candidatus Cybelea sp.]